MLPIVLALCAVLLVANAADPAPTTAPSCYTLTSDDVPFCSFLVGQSVDAIYTTKNQNGQSYVSYVDNQLSQVYQTFIDQIQAESDKYGFQVCDDCEAQFKWLLCGGAFPECGYYGCVTPLISQAFATLCPAVCECTDCQPLLSSDHDCTTNGGTANPNYDPSAASSCDFNQISQTIWNDLPQCSQYELNRSHCQSFVDVCACRHPNWDLVCDNGFGSNGITLPNWPSGTSCDNKLGWCEAISTVGSPQPQSRDTGDDDDDGDQYQEEFCPNKNICFVVPTPIAQRLAAAGYDIDNLNLQAQNFLTTLYPVVTGSAGTLMATPLLVMLGVFFAVLLL